MNVTTLFPNPLRAALVAVVATAFVATGSGCSSEPPVTRPKMFSSGPTYSTVADLRLQADVVVVGRVTSIHSHEEDDGGNGTGRGIPLVFYNFEIERSLAGSIDPGATIQLGWPDPEKVETEEGDGMPGTELLILFADEVSPEEAPGLDTVSSSYFTLGGANGVFTVEGWSKQVKAWSTEVKTLATEPDPSPGSDELRSWPETDFIREAEGHKAD